MFASNKSLELLDETNNLLKTSLDEANNDASLLSKNFDASERSKVLVAPL